MQLNGCDFEISYDFLSFYIFTLLRGHYSLLLTPIKGYEKPCTYVHGFLQMQAHNHMFLYKDKQILAKTMHL